LNGLFRIGTIASMRIAQDCRALRRFRRRLKIERLFAWLNDYKRVIT
jgi:hypothetical protein